MAVNKHHYGMGATEGDHIIISSHSRLTYVKVKALPPVLYEK